MPVDVRCAFAGRVGSRRDFRGISGAVRLRADTALAAKEQGTDFERRRPPHTAPSAANEFSGATWRNGSQEIGDPAEFGAPRPMKMGTTVSPWGYDAVADQALRPDSLRWPAILRYVLLALIDAPHFGDGATTSSASTLTFALTEFEMKQ